ncbi:MAG TPA: tRNA (guanosine(46)-N7)-methyltransferase TrmB [Chromatiaceae bacterium]|jgi:tRNA (guanine-N7-)-methyltransferase|nr:tRNA (guanosine(46)-N7)-methyltransferase TrmB [Chromatiaceae bacterium]HIA08414.1 tRNA (guanosine(46)-N7)-methyltransferase TrmB [Chromatiaceae bacterium]HIO55269.1 tRNA (guanosine(46)-N7)-methyltransferase TrmB [Chromatiales bacterium]
MSAQLFRPIRSFVRREGRLTPGQERALSEHWSTFGVSPTDVHFDFAQLFGRDAPRTLEIGFGNGDTLLHMAQSDPDDDFVGIEVHRPGVGKLLHGLADHRVSNVRIINADAMEIMAHNIGDASFDRVMLLFPDPWPKKRHHKRRIVRDSFIQQVHRVLKPDGLLHMATDWEDYASNMLEQLDACALFRNRSGNGCYSDSRGGRPETKFERRGIKLGHGVWDLIYERMV